MPTPDEQPKSRPGYFLAAVGGAVAGLCGGFLIPTGMGLLKADRAGLGGVLCFGFVGLVAGLTAAVLCVCWPTKGDALGGFEVLMLSLLTGVVAGLFATLPLALLLREWIRGLDSIGHS
jgi:hypothetical protein